MTSLAMRSNALFTRTGFETSGKWQLPVIRKQKIDIGNISLISFSDTRSNDTDANTKHGVHFFVDDYRFNGIYMNPERSIRKLSQYAFLLTPDYSTYSDMNLWRQLESVAHSRWVGAYWQSKGLTVIPTISWGDARSYSFCFDGVENGSIVAVGMIGCKHNKLAFMRGYNAMLDKLSPSAIICFGKPFDDMGGNIIAVDYLSSRKVVR